jgi:hypothetical protein
MLLPVLLSWNSRRRVRLRPEKVKKMRVAVIQPFGGQQSSLEPEMQLRSWALVVVLQCIRYCTENTL